MFLTHPCIHHHEIFIKVKAIFLSLSKFNVFVTLRQRESCGKWYKEIIKGVKERVVITNKIISHLREGNVVKPGGMWNGELRGTWCHPFWKPIVVLLSRFYLPAHYKKHDVEHGHALRKQRTCAPSRASVRDASGKALS